MILFGQNERGQEKEKIFEMLREKLDAAVATFDYEENKLYRGMDEDPRLTLGRFYAGLMVQALGTHYGVDHNGASAYAYDFFIREMQNPTEHWARTSHEEHHLLLMEFAMLHVWPRVKELLEETVRGSEAHELNRLRDIEQVPTLGVQSLLFPQRS